MATPAAEKADTAAPVAAPTPLAEAATAAAVAPVPVIATEPDSEAATAAATTETADTKTTAPATVDTEAKPETATTAPQEKVETEKEAAKEGAAAADVAPAEVPKKTVKKEVKLDAPPPKPTPMSQLWDAARESGHPEIWGVTLQDPEDHIPTRIILQKYLNANEGDFAAAKAQLVKTLQWRAEKKPLELVKKVYSKAKFDGLGFVTSYAADGAGPEPESKETFTWNVYGSTKSIDSTFGNLEEFIEWRVALMEMALQELSLNTATRPATAEYDPYKIYQVHDYKSISFLRQSAQVKAASSETIKVFAQNYPELLKEKFFVNVPAIMGFMYAFVKLFVAAKTAKKFHPMSNGGALAQEFGQSKVANLAEKLPTEYGGKGGDLKIQGVGPSLE